MPLPDLQPALLGFKKSRIRQLTSIAHGRQVSKANIDSNFSFYLLKLLNFCLNVDADEVTLRSIFANSYGNKFVAFRQGARPANLKRLRLLTRRKVLTSKSNSIFNVSDGLTILGFLERR